MCKSTITSWTVLRTRFLVRCIPSPALSHAPPIPMSRMIVLLITPQKENSEQIWVRGDKNNSAPKERKWGHLFYGFILFHLFSYFLFWLAISLFPLGRVNSNTRVQLQCVQRTAINIVRYYFIIFCAFVVACVSLSRNSFTSPSLFFFLSSLDKDDDRDVIAGDARRTRVPHFPRSPSHLTVNPMPSRSAAPSGAECGLNSIA